MGIGINISGGIPDPFHLADKVKETIDHTHKKVEGAVKRTVTGDLNGDGKTDDREKEIKDLAKKEKVDLMKAFDRDDNGQLSNKELDNALKTLRAHAHDAPGTAAHNIGAGQGHSKGGR